MSLAATAAATAVTTTTATLNGSANPKLSSATGWFRYSNVNPGACNDAFGTRIDENAFTEARDLSALRTVIERATLSSLNGDQLLELGVLPGCHCEHSPTADG